MYDYCECGTELYNDDTGGDTMKVEVSKHHWQVIRYILENVKENIQYDDENNEHTCEISLVLPDKDLVSMDFVLSRIDDRKVFK